MPAETYPVLTPRKTWYLLAVGLGLGLGQLLYLVLLYPSLPDPYPIHYELGGQVDGFVGKSPLTVFWVNGVFFALIGLVWWLAGFMGRQVAKDAAAQHHDAFSPHASRLTPRQAAVAERAGLPASAYSARRLYAQTSATLPWWGRLAFTLAVALVLLQSQVAGWGSAATLWAAPALVLGYCLFLTACSWLAGKNFDESLAR